MTRCRTLAGLALLVSMSAQALNLGSLAANFDSTRTTKYPLGDKPQTVCNTLSGWTYAVKGTGDGSICDSSGSQIITAIGNDDEGDFPYLYKDCGSSDCQVTARIPDVTAWEGHSETFTAFGVGITEGTGDSAWYVQAYITPDGLARCKAGTPGPDDYNSISASASLTPEYIGVVHRDSTNEVFCLHSDNGSSWTLFGTFSKALAEPNIGYLFGTSHDVSASSTATVTNLSQSTTISILPGVNHAPACSGIPDQGGVENSAFSLDLSQYCSDSDGDVLSYSATGLTNAGLSVNSSTGLLSGTPNATALAGSPLTVVLTATDAGLLSGSDTFTFTVQDDNPNPVTRNVSMNGSISSNFIRQGNGSIDSFLVETLPVTQVGNDYFSNAETGGNCCASNSGLDSHIATTATIGGATVSPRSGTYFYRISILGPTIGTNGNTVAGKVYNCLNSPQCSAGDATNKPRSKFTWAQTNHSVDSMKEVWDGFSMYIPQNHEHERAKGQHGNGPTIFNRNNNNSEGILELKLIIKGPKSYPTANSGSDLCGNNSTCLQTNDTKFWATWPTRTTLGEPTYDAKDWVELNDVNSCKGKWIDVVIREVNDPFSSTTNPSGSQSGAASISYTGNRGVLEIWTSDCNDAPDATGYRNMVKRVSVCNAPFGLVQRTGTNMRWGAGLTNYAYGWKPGEPTTRTHALELAYDEIYTGQTVRDGTSYADVNPSGKTWDAGQAPCSWSGP